MFHLKIRTLFARYSKPLLFSTTWRKTRSAKVANLASESPPFTKKNMLLRIIPVSIPVNGSVIGMGPPIEKSHVKKGHLFGRGSYNSMGTITITIVIKHWTIHREPILQVHPSIISGLPFLAVQLLGRKWSVDGWDSRPSIEFSGNFRRITTRELKMLQQACLKSWWFRNLVKNHRLDGAKSLENHGR